MKSRTAHPPEVKGWCPGAYRPMASGDGLVFRVRPFFGELTAKQAIGLCEISDTYGNGVLDLTSRANIQIRGVGEQDQDAVLTELSGLALLDSDPSLEGRRNILMPPDWAEGDITYRLYQALLSALPQLPVLPEKMGFALDTGARACLGEGSADFRFELDETGHLLLRADGAEAGRRIDEAEALEALADLMNWFCDTGGEESGRMRKHLARQALPARWTHSQPRSAQDAPDVGQTEFGTILGVPFGKIGTAALRDLLLNNPVRHLRPMLGRRLLIKEATLSDAPGFLTAPSRLMQVHACPGAPFCSQATVETMELAKTLAATTDGTLHVSGCAKGCALPRKATLTLVGRNGLFDLVSDGRPWDEPRQCGLDPSHISKAIGQI